jgi:hypothetical protein
MMPFMVLQVVGVAVVYIFLPLSLWLPNPLFLKNTASFNSNRTHFLAPAQGFRAN